MLSPTDIRPAVEAVLRSATSGLTTYEVLNQLPDPLRQQIIAERGMPGLGSGNPYSAANLVTDAIEGILPSLETPYRVYVYGQAVFTVAGQEIQPGNNAIALYRLQPNPSILNPETAVIPIKVAEPPSLHDKKKQKKRDAWTAVIVVIVTTGIVRQIINHPQGQGDPENITNRVNSVASPSAVTSSQPPVTEAKSKRRQKTSLVAIPAPGRKVLVKGVLPLSDNEEILITVSEKSSGSKLSAFQGQDKPKLNHGTFSSLPFGVEGGLEPGYYTVEARYGNKAMKSAFQFRKDGKVVMNRNPPTDEDYGVTFLSYLGSDNYNPELVKKLLRKHPQLAHSKTDTGETPLIFLAGGRPGDTEEVEAKRLSIAKLLVQSGTRVDGRGVSGRTALCEAASAGDAQLVKYLLDQGASPNKMGDDMVTPYDLAGDDQRIKSLLKQRGGMSSDAILQMWGGKDPERRQKSLRSLSGD